MQSFPKDTQFKLPWRSYQERALKELEGYLKDNHLHVVAAPGSGKTILGIEVIRRLNRPSLILVPTLAIQDQWIERFVNMFLPSGEGTPDWISRDIREPKFLTVATYQGLHSAFSGKSEEEEKISEEEDEELEKGSQKGKKKEEGEKVDIIPRLMEAGIATVVVDEAHHLRNNWWRSLTKTIMKLENPTIIALTATPPFDVSETEWNRYKNLCGPLDAQISVPELVMEKNLCPHQDYVFFSSPSETETETIIRFKNSITKFVKDLCKNYSLIGYLMNHPWWVRPESYLKKILDEPNFFTSILVFLNYLNKEIPEKNINIITTSKRKIPSFNYEWLEILLEGLIFPPNDKDKKLPQFLEDIKRELSQIGALERRTINLRSSKQIENMLRTSISKLKSINKIVELEYKSLRNNLRMVILSDYIRKAFLPKDENDLKQLNKIGIIPIFESIRREISFDLKLGILTGSLIIIPTTSTDMLKSCVVTCGVEQNNIKISKLSFTPNFVEIKILGTDKLNKVRLITELFTRGGIQALIGTKALLGEGWDAPSVNCLILASFVGSYMLSNQMRGRAIRVEKNNPNKTANIWHLICVEPKSQSQTKESEYNINEDLETLTRRFQAFVGPSFDEPSIQNGLNRLNIEDPPFTEKEIESINNEMYNRALDRDQMRENWDSALKKGFGGKRIVEDIRFSKDRLPRGFVFTNTILTILLEAFLIFVLTLSFVFSSFREIWIDETFYHSLELFFIALFLILLILIVIYLPRSLKSLWLLMKHSTIQNSTNQLGIAVLKSLIFTGVIKTKYKKLHISVEKGEMGTLLCHLEGGTNREKSIFLETLQELLNPFEKPKYILIRELFLFGRLTRFDYYPVPVIISTRKKYSLYFTQMWKRYIGEMELVHTRNLEGRIILLKAKNHSISSNQPHLSERVSRWC